MKRNIFALLCFLILAGACRTTTLLQPPKFEHERLVERFFKTNNDGHYPLTVQRGLNKHPTLTDDGFMFYTANRDGSSDIWMRDLNSTVNIPIVRHDAGQHSPAVTPKGDKLVFVSADQDAGGDLRILKVPGSPRRIVRSILNGNETPNLWRAADNLSEAIQAYFEKDPNPSCRGQASEVNPIWSPDGKRLIYVSDRCSADGSRNLWILEMDGVEAASKPRLLTTKGGEQPALSRDGRTLAYVAFRETDARGRLASGGEIFVMDLAGGSELRVKLPLKSSRDNGADPDANGGTGPYLYHSPALSPDGRNLYYVSVREDTNNNGELDMLDKSAVYRIDLAGAALGAGRELRLVEAGTSISGLTYSNMVGGSLLYASNLFNSVNIYLMQFRGVIPRRKTIDEQYQATFNFSTASLKRYLLSLDAVKFYFGKEPAWVLYEGRVLLDKIRRLRAAGNRPRELRLTQRKLRAVIDRSPYVGLQSNIEELENRGESTLPAISRFLANFPTVHGPKYKGPARRLVNAAVLEKLARVRLKEGKYAAGLVSAQTLNKNFPEYHRRYEAMLLEAKLALETNPRIPDVLGKLLRENGRPLSRADQAKHRLELTGANVKNRETALSMVYNFYNKKFRPADALKIADEQNKRSDLHPLLRVALKLVQARAWYDLKRYARALDVGKKAMEGELVGYARSLAISPTDLLQVKESAEFLKQAAKAEDDKNKLRYIQQADLAARTYLYQKSGLYVLGFRVIAFSLEKLGRNTEAYFAKLEYGGQYRPEYGVNINVEEYLSIIAESERTINLYLRTARSVVRSVDASRPVPDKVLGNIGLGNIGLGNIGLSGLTKWSVDIASLDREVLSDFCDPGSRSVKLIGTLGLKVYQRYQKFCEARTLIESGRPVPSGIAKEASQLLYLASNANATILNIMFLHIKGLNLFNDLYRERAVHYHRSKIDIALEQNQRRLEWERQRFQVLKASDLQQLVGVGDPFDSRAFKLLESGYTSPRTDKEAREFGDLSMLYGYAYTLIRKSVQREQFYDGLQKAGVFFTEQQLKQFKKSILEDMKRAEYRLRYIIFTDPRNTDAYLLLGWLYQYLDTRKSNLIKIPPGYIERIYNYVSGTAPATPTDGRFYNDFYRVYFPGRLLETNVELYRQALNMKAGDPAAARDRSLLSLNLGNNYFSLLNFKRAVRHYKKVSVYVDRTGSPIFDSHTQEGLFYYNHGRALFYQGDSAAAAEKFLRAYNIYDEYERKPLHKEFTAMSYRRLAGAGVADPRALRLFIHRQKELLRRDKIVRSKMALIAAMLGMVYWEAGRYDESILFYRDAERRLYRGGEADKSSVVEPGNLRNFIALAYQSKRDFVNSERSAKRAQEFVEKVGLQKNDTRFQPQSLTSRILGCLLNYGEDFSVIGDGRNPFGFSTLRQYELSLGIRLENKVLRGDLDGVTELLKARRKVFRKEDGDVALGKEGQVTTYNNEAYFNFRAGRYTRALIGFRQAAKKALDMGNLRGFRMNLSNRFHAMFAYFESGRATPSRAIALIEKGLRDIREQEFNYAAQVKEQYIIQRKKENADFEFGKIDEINIREKIRRDLFDLVVIQGLIHYYHGRMLDGRAGNQAGVALARGHYLKSLKKLDAALNSAGPNRRIASIRIRLNRSRVLIALGRLFEADRELALLKEKTFEFNLLREQWEALWAGAALFSEIHDFRKTKASLARAAQDVDEAVKILRRNPQVHFGSNSKLEEFYEFAADFFIRTGNPERALAILEQKWEHYLQREYLRFPLVFADLKFNAGYNRLRFLTDDARRLEQRESALRIKRADVEKIRARKKALRGEITELRNELLALKPTHKVFLRFIGGTRPSLSRDQLLIRLFSRGDSISAWVFRADGVEFKTIKLKQGVLALENLYAEMISASESYKDVFLIVQGHAATLQPAAVLKKIRPGLPHAVYTTRLSDALTGFQDRVARARTVGGNLNLFNVDTSIYREAPKKASKGFLDFDLPFENPFESSFEKREADGKKKKARSFYSEHYDIVAMHASKRGGVFPVVRPGLFDPRLWLSRERTSSLVLLNRPGKKASREEHRRQAGIYEVLRATGVGSVLFRAKIAPADVKELRSKAGSGRIVNAADMVFGSPGFQRNQLRPVLLELHERANAKGRVLEGRGEFERAGESFSVAVSLLRGLSGVRRLNLDARLNLVRAAMSERRFEKAVQELEEILKEYKDEGFSVQSRVYQLAVRLLYGAGKPAEAGEYLAAFLKRFPRRGEALKREAAVLSFLEKLKRRKYSVSELNQDMQSIRPFPTSGSDAMDLMREFARRGMYKEALTMAAGLRRRSALRNDVNIFLYKLSRHAELLNIPGISRGYAPPANLEGAAGLLKLAQDKNWEQYDKTVVELPGEKGDPVLKFRRRMFLQWKIYKQKSYLSLQEIAGVRVGGSGLTAYHAVTALERSMLYRMFISAIPADPDLQVGKFLGDLIQAERGPNPERGARMALGAALGFLRLGDVHSALGFLKIYGDAAKRALNLPEELEARTGLAVLASAGDSTFKTRLIRRNGFLGTKKPAELRRRWSERLTQAGKGDVVALYASVARNRPINELIGALPAGRARSLLPELRIAVALRRRTAEKARNWRRLLNLAFYSQSLRNYAARMRSTGRRVSAPPAYAELIKGIMTKIPRGQVFTAMVDQNSTAYFMRITRGGISSGKMQYPGRLLRGRMYLFLDGLRRGRSNARLYDELAWAYRSLLGYGRPRISYFWFEGIHMFAPLGPRRGDRVYQVLDPAAMAGKAVGTTGEFGGQDFRVRVRGQRDWARLSQFMDTRELQWRQRVAGMESIAIGARDDSSASPLHVISDVYASPRGAARLPSELTGPGPWFLAGNRLLESPDTEVENMGYLMAELARRFQEPGVMVLRKPRLLSHPYFVKFYYSRASPARSIELRYINAFLRMRRTLAAGTVLYGYRLVTPTFVKDP